MPQKQHAFVIYAGRKSPLGRSTATNSKARIGYRLANRTDTLLQHNLHRRNWRCSHSPTKWLSSPEQVPA